MKMLAVCCLLLSALCLRAELAFKWTVEVSQPLPYAAEALQGESFNLEAKVVQYRVPMLEAAEATFYYQTPEMEASQWYTVPAAWDATTATASVAFTPAMDVGDTKYRFFFGIETAQGKNYRVFGTLRLKASPGFSPATLEPTDVRAEIIQEIVEAVFEESDERYATKAEHAALAVQVDGKADASHTHTIAQVSNLQTQLNAKAATSTVSALTTRLTAAEAAIEEVADAKQDKLTRETSSNNVGSLDPQDRNSMASAGNMGDVSFMLGTLKDWSFTGEAVTPKKITLFRSGSGTTNGDTDMWLRILRWDGAAWYVAYQATTYVTHSSYTDNGQRIEHTMAYKSGTVYIPTDERLLVCYATSADADATAFINFGAKAIASTTMNILTGQSQMAASPSASGGFRQALAIEAEYTVAQDLRAELEGKADAFTVGEGLTLEAGVLSADTPSIFTEPVKIQNGMGTGSLWIGGDTNAGTLTNNQRHLARIVVPSFSDVTKGATLLGFDSSGDADMSVANKGYDVVSFGGMKKIANATSPMAIGFCVTKTRGAMSENDKVYPMEMDANEVRFNVRATVNGAAILTVSNLPTMSMEGLSLSGQNGSASFSFLADGGVTFSTTSKGTTRSATLVGQAALDGKADAQHTHAFEEMVVTVSGASYRWQWDETEGTFALVAEE